MNHHFNDSLRVSRSDRQPFVADRQTDSLLRPPLPGVLQWIFGALLVPVAAVAQDEPTTVDLGQVVVTGSNLPTETSELGRSITVLDQEDILALGVEYAADVFRFVPGVAVSRTGGYSGLTQLRLRGAEGNHVLVLIDGIEVAEAGGGEFDFSSLLARDIERIEILRGPQSGLYGSNALAGVVHIRTRRATPGLELGGTVEVGENSSRQASVSIAGGSEELHGRLNWIYRSSEFDVSEDNSLIGREDDQDLNRTVSGQLSWLASSALRFDLLGRFTNRHADTDGFDFSGGPLQGLPVDNDGSSKTEDLTLGLSANLTLAGGRSESRLSFEYTDNETVGTGFGSEASREQIRAQTTWLWQDRFDQRTTLFLQDEQEEYRNTQPFDPTQVPTQTRDLTGFGLEHRAAIDDTWFLGATIRRDDNDQFEDVTTFSADAAWKIASTGTRVHASIGTGVTNPTFFEQFGFTPGQFKGNPNLEPEETTGWDLGVEQQFLDGDLVMDLTYFDADLEKEIVSFFDVTDFLSTSINQDQDSERSGVEFGFDYSPEAPWRVSGTFTHIDASEPAGTEVRRPENTASLTGSYVFADNRASVTANLFYSDSQLDNDFRNFFVIFAAERTELDSYFLLNLNGSYRITPQIEAYLRIINALDEDYQEVLGYETPGRTAFVGLRFDL
ncbi:MAG: TonB-dependent receptor [Pseudomonadota bacterium]